MTEYKVLGKGKTNHVKSRLILLKDLGFTILRKNFFAGNFLVGSMTGGLQVAPEKETDKIDVRFQTDRINPEYRDTFQITTFTSPYRGILPCRCISADLNLTPEQRWEDTQREKSIFPNESSLHYYIYPTFKDLQSSHGSDQRAYITPRDLVESTGILEESQS